MVFFSIAMLVSSIMIVQTESASTSIHGDAARPTAEVADMLKVLMGASIGRAITIRLESELVIRGYESVAECLSAELHALSQGVGLRAFDSLNEAIADVLSVLSGPVLRAHLLAVHPQGPSTEPALAIPGLCMAERSAHSSSMELSCGNGLLFTIILVLEPATLPEFV